MASATTTSSSSPSTSTPSPPSPRPRKPSPEPSFFPTYALDQAFCGIGAGIVSTFVMHPLDLVKVRFQVATASNARQGILREIWNAVADIGRQEGVKGMYRGLTPNLVGNASSWGLYFLWYTMIKARKDGGDPSVKLSAGQHLLASAESGVITAVMTNPLWVVKTRMFTTSPGSPNAYKNVFDGLNKLARQEGLRGLSKGMALALFGVSNGAIQFMTYEELKRWRIDVRRKWLGNAATEEEAKSLSNIEYILMSGSAKLVAIGITYPYQVVRSRIQYQPPTIPPYTSIPNCIQRTFASEGISGFYKGLATNAVRILPGTCVTFVVYEQLSRFLERRARVRDVRE
ncbi:putative flavin-adenine dinucleotide transporter [Meredithblackwellia eburnea MCA 4105]